MKPQLSKEHAINREFQLIALDVNSPEDDLEDAYQNELMYELCCTDWYFDDWYDDDSDDVDEQIEYDPYPYEYETDFFDYDLGD